MTDMNRRGFIRGLLTSAAAGTALVKLATPAEAEALSVRQPILIGQPEIALPGPDLMDSDGLVYAFNTRTNDFQPIGYITQLQVHTAIHENLFWDGHVELVPGLKRASLDFRGPLR